MQYQIHHGDCRKVMPTLHPESVDSIVCDPPYGLSFMGKGWDHGVPGVEFWVEALRVAKPGAHLLAFGGTRTYHRLACAIEDAGWEIRDCVMWVYGSGFPKSHDVSKAIDKAAGAVRPRVPGGQGGNNAILGARKSGEAISGEAISGEAISGEAIQWSGWGTALKPAWEPIIVARKPLCGTVAENVLKHGTGGINVDGCRVPHGDEVDLTAVQRQQAEGSGIAVGKGYVGSILGKEIPMYKPGGRWPANLIHDGSDEVVGLFPGNVKGGTWNRTAGARHFNNEGEPTGYQTSGSDASTGSAARFFYCAKASKADRDEGCEGLPVVRVKMNNGNEADGDPVSDRFTKMARNTHPTVKPTALMRYLCRLVTPPGGVVLDPFTGSGSTGKAAVLEGFDFVGIEREAEYVEIARARIAAAAAKSAQPSLPF